MKNRVSPSKKSIQTQSHTVAGGAHAHAAPVASTTIAAGSPATFAERVTAAVAAITQARALLGLDDDVLSSKEVKLAVKFKKGGEQYVPTLANLSATYGVEVPSRPTAEMNAFMQRANELEPARAAISALSTVVDGAYFASRSATWSTATGLYSMLRKGSKGEPKLAAALVPLREYFASRHPSVAAQHPKSAVAAQADKAQAKVQKKLAKLQAQIAKLQASATPTAEPAPEPVTASPPAPAPAGAAHGA